MNCGNVFYKSDCIRCYFLFQQISTFWQRDPLCFLSLVFWNTACKQRETQENEVSTFHPNELIFCLSWFTLSNSLLIAIFPNFAFLPFEFFTQGCMINRPWSLPIRSFLGTQFSIKLYWTYGVDHFKVRVYQKGLFFYLTKGLN